MTVLDLIISYWPQFLAGTEITIKLTLAGLGAGSILGILAALGRVYGSSWIRRVAIGYIELFRGTPMLVQLFAIYFGLPDFVLTLSRMTAAYLVLALNSGAYQAEYFRGAIQAIAGGQMMAARSIGMSRWQAIRYIILPQALRIVIPAWSNEPITLMKSSAVVFLIAVPDLMTQSKIVASRTYQPIASYLVAAVIYMALAFGMTSTLGVIEKKYKIPVLEIESHRG